MRSLKLREPYLRRHKPSKQGIVTLSGRDHYLGPWPDGQNIPPAEIQTAYDRLKGEWQANGRICPCPACRPAVAAQPDGITIDELLAAYWRHAEQHYRDASGQPTDELGNMCYALRHLADLYGSLPVAEFSPLKLKAVRQKMLDARRYHVRLRLKIDDEETILEQHVWNHEFRQRPTGCEARWKKKWHPAELLGSERALLCGVINQRVRRIVRVFRWAITEELVPETVHRALASVSGLQQGRTEAPESDGIKPVEVEVVEATLPKLPAPVAAMVQLQLLTGCRPAEIMVMRGIGLCPNPRVIQYPCQVHKAERQNSAIGGSCH